MLNEAQRNTADQIAGWIEAGSNAQIARDSLLAKLATMDRGTDDPRVREITASAAHFATISMSLRADGVSAAQGLLVDGVSLEELAEYSGGIVPKLLRSLTVVPKVK